MNKIIVLFSSTRDTITAERVCLRNAVPCQAIPVPRNITADCGIALEINREDEVAVQSLFEKESIAADFREP
jgi:hypothetical protein